MLIEHRREGKNSEFCVLGVDAFCNFPQGLGDFSVVYLILSLLCDGDSLVNN